VCFSFSVWMSISVCVCLSQCVCVSVCCALTISRCVSLSCVCLSQCVCVCVCVCVYVIFFTSMQMFKKAKGVNTLDLELKTVVSCLTWILGTKPWSSGRAASSLKYQAISPAPPLKFMYVIAYRPEAGVLVLFPILQDGRFKNGKTWYTVKETCSQEGWQCCCCR